ncbi:MAG TPA: hypothetical protein VF701_02825 [Thermoanaerobaculia bacterium]
MDRKPETTPEERAAEQRRRDIEGPKRENESEITPDTFNPLEGVAPHGAGVPDRKD